MAESIRVETVLPAPAQRIYEAWLDAEEHGEFTGGEAEIDPTVGGRHSAWDGYIQGVTLELEPYSRIVQSWRTTEFPEGSPDSRLEVVLEESGGSTRVTLIHTEIPDGQGAGYETGWRDFYFKPMAEYFAGAG